MVYVEAGPPGSVDKVLLGGRLPDWTSAYKTGVDKKDTAKVARQAAMSIAALNAGHILMIDNQGRGFGGDGNLDEVLS